MTNLIKEISFNTNISSDKTYLITNIIDLQLIDFQIEMVNRNVDGAFLTIEKREIDSKIQLHFETTSLISMESYLRSNKISRKNFLDIIKNLCLALVKAEEQYLSVNNYILELNKIYIDKESLKVKYIYIPIEQNYYVDVDEKFKYMIKDIVADYANIDDTDSKHYLKKILDFLEKEKVNIQAFYEFFINNVYRYINDIEKEQENIQCTLKENTSFDSQSNEIQSNLNNDKQINDNPIEINNNNSHMINNQSQVSNNLENGEKQSSKETGFKEVYKPENITVCAVTGFATVILAILTFVMLSNSYIVEKLVIVLILALVDFLVFIVFLDKEDKVKSYVKENVSSSSKNQNLNNFDVKKGMEKNNSDDLNMNDQLSNDNLNNFDENSSIANNDINYNIESGDLGTSDNSSNNLVGEINNPQMTELSEELSEEESEENYEGETTLLTINQPYLLSNDLGETKKIYIDKDRFVIGRLSAKVDYAVLDKVVGKTHAEIISKDGMYYIIDLDSKNGTFINRKRIESNVAHVLNDEDEIMIANIKYILKLY